MDFKARVIEIPESQEINGRNGAMMKHFVIVETLDNYPKKVCLIWWNDRINKEDLVLNEIMTFYIDLESREYNGKWYSDIRVWRVERFENKVQAPKNEEPKQNINNNVDKTDEVDNAFADEIDDLPF